MADIFISYRRDDTAGYAGRLHEALERRLGRGRVFRDVDTLRPGEDFVAAIDERVRRARVSLVVIGREFLGSRDAAGPRRIDRDDDYVRYEIAAALAQPDRLVIPLLVEGASMPEPAELPDSIRGLSRRHAFSLRDDAWDADVDRLVALIGQSAPVAPDAGEPQPHVSRSAVPRSGVLWAGVVLLGVTTLGFLLVRSPARQVPEPLPERDSGGTGVPADSARGRGSEPGEAYAIGLPPLADVAHGPLIYSVISGGLAPMGDSGLLRLRIRVANQGRYDANFWDSAFRLVTDARVLAPTGGLNQVVAGRTVEQGMVTFDVPRGNTTATLRITGNGPPGDIPLDLTPSNRPPAGEGAEAGEAPSRAALFDLRAAGALLSGEGLEVRLDAARGRRFVNVTRLTFAVRMRNRGRYPRATGDLQLRVAAGGRLTAPIDAPSEVVEADAEQAGEYVFDINPAARRAVLQASIGRRSAEQTFDLP